MDPGVESQDWVLLGFGVSGQAWNAGRQAGGAEMYPGKEPTLGSDNKKQHGFEFKDKGAGGNFCVRGKTATDYLSLDPFFPPETYMGDLRRGSVKDIVSKGCCLLTLKIYHWKPRSALSLHNWCKVNGAVPCRSQKETTS